MIPIEPSGEIRNNAALLRQIFLALRQTGFDEPQAMRLVEAWIHAAGLRSDDE